MRFLLPSRTWLLCLAFAPAAWAQVPLAASQAKSVLKRPLARAYQAPFKPDVILLDPAHGGDDAGSRLSQFILEKDFVLAFATRLESLLTSAGFTVVLTQSDADHATSADQRAEAANRSRAVACLLLHASASGNGVHLFTSSLTPPLAFEEAHPDAFLSLWDAAQATALQRSLQLANELANALNSQRIPLVVARASIAPIDSLTCPAVALEIAPPPAGGALVGEAYQQQIAVSLVTALGFWRQRAQNLIAAEQAAASASPPNQPPLRSPRPKPKLRPRPIHTPDEVPLAPLGDASTPKPAPVVRLVPGQPGPVSSRPGGGR